MSAIIEGVSHCGRVRILLMSTMHDASLERYHSLPSVATASSRCGCTAVHTRVRPTLLLSPAPLCSRSVYSASPHFNVQYALHLPKYG